MKGDRNLSEPEAELAQGGAIDERVVIHQVHPVIIIKVIGAAVGRCAYGVVPVHAIPPHLSPAFAYRIIGLAGVVVLINARQSPFPYLFSAIIKAEVLSERAGITLPVRHHINAKTFADLAIAVGKYTPTAKFTLQEPAEV